jgi:hypothetical chaperone protein
MLTIGIDFGTTNCSAAIYRDGRIDLIPLEGDRPVMPSTICITNAHEVSFGEAAIQRYLALVGRAPIRYTFTDLRELAPNHGEPPPPELAEDDDEADMLDPEESNVLVSLASDDDRPARLFQSLKTALRDPDYHGTSLYGQYYAIEELIALVLGHIRESAERYLGQPVTAALIGRPVSYAPADPLPGFSPEEINRTAAERMLAAARMAGFTHAALELEPVGATRHLQRQLEASSRALVFDFGGGTLDLALVRTHGEYRPDILATHGLPLGGDDFDSAIMEHCLLHYFGQGTTLNEKRLPFPDASLDPLLHWQTISQLATPASAAYMASLKRQSNAPETIGRLQTLVREGLGFRLFQLIEQAKIRLSDETTATISLHEKGLDIEETITRGQLAEAISHGLGLIREGVEAILRADPTGETAPPDAVLMTGGSSLVPAVQGMVRRASRSARVLVADPFTSIATGLSMIAADEPEMLRPVAGLVASATAARIVAEQITIGSKVAFQRGSQTMTGLVVGRAGNSLHDATLLIEFWDAEIEEYVSTMRHETKVQPVNGD